MKNLLSKLPDNPKLPKRVIYYLCDGEEVSLSVDAIIVSIPVPDWNRDLSPWTAPRVFLDGEDFGGAAAEYLRSIEETTLQTESLFAYKPESRGIAGYSLAGLFAVWALYHSSLFDRAASMSGSLWFDGFTDFMNDHRPVKVPEKLYLSVGEQEKRTKSRRMAQVEACTLRTAEIFRGYGTDVQFEKNPGGHFNNIPERVARGLQWLAL
ncbi:MAG: hypothetical protein IJB20_00175 [Clostridia bacterium]|nr:hypothetical protein [Clostridia bacterium]